MESTRNVRRRTISLNSPGRGPSPALAGSGPVSQDALQAATPALRHPSVANPGTARAPQDALQAPAPHSPPVASPGAATAPRLRPMASASVPPTLDRCRRQLHAALRDGHFNLFSELLSDAEREGTTGALVGAAGGEALRVALTHDRYEESLALWRSMTPAQRSASLDHGDGALWACLPNASVRLVNWVLHKAGVTAEAREASTRPHSAHLVRAMAAAIRQGQPAVLHALWDRATWGEWHQAAVQGFRVAYAQDDAATVAQIFGLSLGDPALRTHKALIRQLEDENGPLVRAVSVGKTRLLATLRPFLADHERGWLRSLVLAAAHPSARGAISVSL